MERLGSVAAHLQGAASAAGEDVEETVLQRELLSMVTSLDARSYAANRMTAAERQFYEREGYLIIPNAIESDSDVEELKGLLDWMREENLKAGKNQPTDRVNRAAFSQNNSPQFSRSDAMVRLLTTPKVFPKVVDALGWNISLYHVQINTVPPGEETIEPDWSQAPTLGFHQDNGRSNIELDVPKGVARPRLTLKCAYFLTDLSQPGMGQTWLIPQSHKAHGREDVPGGWPEGGVGQGAGIPILVPPNTCVIFNRSTFHSASPNYSQVERKTIFVGYGYRWVRPKDPLWIGPLLVRLRCPVLKQLCGTSTSNNGWWSPSSIDTPLRAWLYAAGLRENHGIGWDESPLSSFGLKRLDLAQLKRLGHVPDRLRGEDLPAVESDEEQEDAGGAKRLGESDKLRLFIDRLEQNLLVGRTPSPKELTKLLQAIGYNGS